MLPEIFRQPYPCEESPSKQIVTIASISSFVFAFLWLFAPFGLDNLDIAERLYVCLGYGLACAAAMALNYYLIQPGFPSLFDESDWTVGRQILWFSWILVTISIFNSIYSTWIGISPWSFSQLLTFIGYVTLIGIFPVGALVLLDYLRLYRKHARQAEALQEKLSLAPSTSNRNLLTLISDNQNEQLQLLPDELLYLSSADNYVKVVYKLDSDLQKELLRGSLKSFEKQLQDTALRRCHRSYIVNLSKVVTISGNAQGYSLKLRGTDVSIPVSRSYSDNILSSLR